MGKRFERVTEEINYRASVDVALKAKRQGVRTFTFASSCSIYGFAEGLARKESHELSPLTAYARSKVMTEKAIEKLACEDFVVTSLRFSTACGMSDRLRLDLVLNDFVACAVSSGEIAVLSDGTPWRPLIHVRDIARAIEWASKRRPDEGGKFLAVNVGSDDWNYQVRHLADAVRSVVNGTKVSINKNAQPDKRSYKVDFSLFRELAPSHQPVVSLEQAIEELKNGLEEIKFSESNFRETEYVRLNVLENHIKNGRLSEELFWR
jgi:nucleoside-diphosphate-sugar epimerase